MEGFWKNIPDFPGYQVSKDGQVRSFWGKGRVRFCLTREPKILVQTKKSGRSPYYSVCLQNKDRKKYTVNVHKLVYTAFCGDIPEGMQLDHLDRNLHNNSLENIRLCTRAQNRRNIAKTSKKKSSKYLGVSWCQRSKKWIAQIVMDKKHYSLGYFNSEEEAALVRDSKLREMLSEKDLEFVIFNIPH